MRLYRVRQATNEIVKLDGKHRDLWESVTQFERLLSHGQTHGHTSSLGGKRSGLRYVYERVTIGNEEYAVALTVYVHQEGNKESDVVDRIRKRSQFVDATPQGFRALDGSDTQMLLQ